MRTALAILLIALLLGGGMWLLRTESAGESSTETVEPVAELPASTAEPAPTAERAAQMPVQQPMPSAVDDAEPRGPLALPIGHGFSYRDMLTDVGARLDRVAERLADPMCQTDRHLYRPALRARCAAEDLVLLAELATRCRRLADGPRDGPAAPERLVGLCPMTPTRPWSSGCGGPPCWCGPQSRACLWMSAPMVSWR